MQLRLVFALFVMLLELVVGGPTTSLDPYGRPFRNSRMSNQEADDEDDDQDDEDEDNDEQDDDIYPPDFSKLFPNPDNRPVGPGGGSAASDYGSNHPTSQQHGRPAHGPAALRGPASLRGPIQAQQGQKQGGMFHGRPQQDGPPPNYQPTRRGPPPKYRLEEDSDEDVIPEGRQMPIYRRPMARYPVRRIQYGGMPMRRWIVPAYPRYPMYHQTRRVQKPTYTPVMYGRRDIESGEDVRSGSGRVYNPWSRNPLRPDAYNPQFVYNPTEMRLRRRFRYHPSQLIPNQRIQMYSGEWGNPRNSYVHRHTGQHYGSPSYWGSQF